MQKFTQKSLEAIQMAQNTAVENHNSQIEQDHILYALLEQENSLIKEIIKRMGMVQSFEEEVKNKIAKKPKMTGGADGNIYISQDANTVLTKSEEIANQMKDEYISVEHIMLSLFENANTEIKEL